MRAVAVSPRAKQDLFDILTFIANDDIDIALRVVDEIEALFAAIAQHPFAGHTRTDLGLDPRYRVWPIYSYLVIYLPDSDPVQIVRVWHTARRSPDV